MSQKSIKNHKILEFHQPRKNFCLQQHYINLYEKTKKQQTCKFVQLKDTEKISGQPQENSKK